MTEPTRFLSAPESELERALLDAGRSYSAPGSTRAKTLLALGLTAVATTTAPAAAAATSSLTKAALSKVAVAVLVIGAAVPAFRYLNHAGSTPVASPAPRAVLQTVSVLPTPVESAAVAPTPVESAAAAPTPVESAAAAPTPVESAAVEAAELQPSISAHSAGNARTEPKVVSDPPLTAELAALDSARTSLSHSDPAAALVALDGYTHNFPRGRLRIEAEVLRIGALAKSGQTDAARRRAQAFLRLHPDSVLASRVRSYAGL